MKRLTLILIAFIFSGNAAVAEIGAEDASNLEAMFINAKTFNLVYRYQEVPMDIRQALFQVAKTDSLANFGQTYNVTDVVDTKFPTAQHQYTIYTDHVSASLLKVGGFAPAKWLILVDRDKPDIACKYQVKWELEFSESLQYLIKNKRKLYKGYFQGVPICRALTK